MITAGTIDTTFLIGSGFNSMVYTTVVQPDGKILVGGNFNGYDGNITKYLTRLNTDGSIDTGFQLSLLNKMIRAIAIEPDGKILVGGYFTNYNGTTTIGLIRLNTDGTPNGYFNPGFNCNSCNDPSGNGTTVRTITVQPDGKILVGGTFNEYGGNSNINYIVRLNQDGTIDSTFNVGSGFDAPVYSIVVKPNGDILIGGDFTSYNSNTVGRIVLVSSTGTLLNTFGTGADDRVQKIKLQSDGKILVGGHFTSFNGSPIRYMIRLTSTGLVDFVFNFNDWVIDMLEQNDGRILVAGQFSNYDGFTVFNFARINPSGTFDGSFIQGGGFNDYVNSVSLLQNGNILASGRFNQYDSETYKAIISLNNDESTYQYQYVYEAKGCYLGCSPFTINNLPIYYVGSDVELSNGDIISLYDINNPSFVQCAAIISVTNISAEPTHVYQSTYNNCETCLSNISVIAYCTPCNNSEEFGRPIPVVVSNLYNVGDILTIPETIVDSEGNFIYYFNDCFTISAIIPYETCEYFETPQVINYQPKQSCEECTSCLGRYYAYSDCVNPDETGIIYSHQNLSIGDTILFQSGNSSCKQIEFTESVISAPLPIFELFSGTPVVNSTVVYSSCTECLNLTTWSEEIEGDGIVDFNDPLPVPFPTWGIIGPDNDSCEPGWTYVKYQFTESGSLTFFYDFTTSEDLCCDWPFYYVSPNEPIGDTNIDFSEGGPSNVFGSNYATSPGVITINYNSGDWVSIGVYSTDCVEGPGILFISSPQTQENSPYTLHNFTTCDGQQGFVNIPSSQESQLVDVTQIPYSEITSEGLDSMPEPGGLDDDFIEIPFPTDFSSNFLCGEYNNVYMSTNGFITFGGGYGDCCFEIPNEIPTNSALPGVYISNNEMAPSNSNCMDTYLFDWYSGFTNSGNNFVIKFVGSYYYPVLEEGCEDCPPFVYSFVFYKNQPNYFDLYIESNGAFCNNNPIGGVSNGINTNFLGTFNSSSQKAYRITTTCPVIKSNYGTTPAVCGTIGGSSTEIGVGELYYSDVNQTYNSCEDCGQVYGVTLRECSSGEIVYTSMSFENINFVETLGPIFANGGTECYELLDYCIIPHNGIYYPSLFYPNCEICKQPFSAGTESKICVVCCSCTTGETVNFVSPPHPVWTNARGKAVVLLDAITLGGMNGLNN